MKAPTMKAAKAKGPKPIYVTLKKGRHKTQPWTFTIDEPGVGPAATKRERYARKYTAKRGALRMLRAFQYGNNLNGSPVWIVPSGIKGQPIRTVIFQTAN